MKSRGFTLLELVIVMVLIGVSAVFGTRFIAGMAEGYMGNAERSQALAGARFAMERLRRELAVAYGPSVYISTDQRCLSFVPALASGTYQGLVRSGLATFLLPVSLQGEPIMNVFMAIRAETGETYWAGYPADVPADVFALTDQPAAPKSLAFDDAVGSVAFSREGFSQRYTLLKSEQVRYCARDGGLWREVKSPLEDWGKSVLMVSGITQSKVFLGYDESTQLVRMELLLATRDGELVLPAQLQVNYAP